MSEWVLKGNAQLSLGIGIVIWAKKNFIECTIPHIHLIRLSPYSREFDQFTHGIYKCICVNWQTKRKKTLMNLRSQEIEREKKKSFKLRLTIEHLETVWSG